MKIGTKGFTLIELIISMAMLGVVATMCFGFMLSGMNSYNSVFDNVDLQFKSQLAMNHMREYMIDATTAIYFDTTQSKLYIINEVEEDKTTGKLSYVAHTFVHETTTGEILYGKNTATQNANGTYTMGSVLIKEEMLTDMVASFTVIFTKDIQNIVDIARVEMVFQKNNKSYSGLMDVAPRNKPLECLIN